MKSERDALVALLRYTDASKRWRETTSDAYEKGALSLLSEWAPQTLIDDTIDDLLDRSHRDIATWETSTKSRLVTMFDDDYPAQFKEVHDLPPFIFARGELRSWEEGVCLVGSRKASDAGIAFAREVASGLAEEGYSIVSGLAAGIDTAAHTAALDRSGRTVAVIGTGIDRAYPAENRWLHERIAHNGLVISQFWPGSPPTRATFPMRNATMSAFGSCTLIVQATEQSGARIQARQALAHGRPLLLTEWVVAGTQWGAEFARSQGDVSIVKTADDALAAIGQILDRPHQLQKQLLSLVR